MAFNNIYNKKRVLVTGNTGFKGSWLSSWLVQLGAEVYGFSINIPTNPSMFETLGLSEKINHKYGDIRNVEELNDYVQKIKPDFIFHLAAQAIVSTSYLQPFDTITTNVVGTTSILESICRISWECTCVIITSDKAYDNVEWLWGYRETDALGGKDIYSGSKGAAELIIKSYWNSFIAAKSNINFGIARAGNVIGGGDWATDRIIVDCIKAFSQNKTVELRCPNATRPWQHVLEPLSGYLTLGWYLIENKTTNGEAYNFGPHADQNKTVFDLTEDLAERWGLDKNKVVRIIDNLPFKESTLLKLNCDKAYILLHWHSTLKYSQCVSYISDWYKDFYTSSNSNLFQKTIDQIEAYTSEAKTQNLRWSI